MPSCPPRLASHLEVLRPQRASRIGPTLVQICVRRCRFLASCLVRGADLGEEWDGSRPKQLGVPSGGRDGSCAIAPEREDCSSGAGVPALSAAKQHGRAASPPPPRALLVEQPGLMRCRAMPRCIAKKRVGISLGQVDLLPFVLWGGLASFGAGSTAFGVVSTKFGERSTNFCARLLECSAGFCRTCPFFGQLLGGRRSGPNLRRARPISWRFGPNSRRDRPNFGRLSPKSRPDSAKFPSGAPTSHPFRYGSSLIPGFR